MIKVDVIRTKETIKFVFETRDVSTDGLEKFDELYAMILGSMEKEGGYNDSNRFSVEILLPKDEE